MNPGRETLAKSLPAPLEGRGRDAAGPSGMVRPDVAYPFGGARGGGADESSADAAAAGIAGGADFARLFPRSPAGAPGAAPLGHPADGVASIRQVIKPSIKFC